MQDKILDKVVPQLAGAYLDYNRDDPSQSLSRITWSMNATKEKVQCDIYRMYCMCKRPNAVITFKDAEELYNCIDTYGDLNQKIKPYISGGDIDATYPQLLRFNLFNIGDFTYKLTTPNDIRGAWAHALIDSLRFDEAAVVISEMDTGSQLQEFLRMYAFYVSKRWGDILDMAVKVPPYIVDVYDNPTKEVDRVVSALTNFMVGTAFAHLGEKASAFEKFDLANSQSSDIYILAETYRIAGLLERRESNEDGAQEYFSKGESAITTEETRKAKDDLQVSLDVTTRDLIDQRTSYWDPSTQPSLSSVMASDAEDQRATLLEEAEEELNNQIGMDGVKEQVDRVKASVAIDKIRKERGIGNEERTNHLIFTGPPGTGKTTIARVISKIYQGLGVTKTNKFMEASPKDFIGEHLGETPQRTTETLDKALGGILFIDEAYGLANSDSTSNTSDFGKEAITTMIAYMENHRGDIIIIIAGYKDDIESLLNVNDGLRSRFNTTIEFRSYTPAEMGDIADFLARKASNILSPEGKQAIIDEIERMSGKKSADGKFLIDKAGNGRFARKIIELAYANMSVRLINSKDMDSMKDEDLTTLTKEDVQMALESLRDSVK